MDTGRLAAQLISIHALREESDLDYLTGRSDYTFQSTLSVRRATDFLSD